MWTNPHPRSLALWTGDAEHGQRHVFDLTLSLEELMERDDFGDFCCDIEHNLGILDFMGEGEGEDGYEGFGTDVEPEQVLEIVGRFADFLNAHALLLKQHEPVALSEDLSEDDN